MVCARQLRPEDHVFEKGDESIAKSRGVTMLTLCASVFECNNSVSSSVWFGCDGLLAAIIVFRYALMRQTHPFL